MPIIHKSGQSLNLASYRTWIVDTDPTSRYFRLNQIPDTLTAGKNAFLINGAPELVSSTDIKIELIDANGNPVFLQPIKNYVEGLARVVSIEVYSDTAPGVATLTILGHISQDADGNLPPAEFVNAYNVKWVKQILIAPETVNSTTIRLYNRPNLEISELLLPVYLATGSVSASLNTGTAKLSFYNATPSIATTAINRVDISGSVVTCSRYMVGGTFSAMINGIPFTSSITSVINTTAFTVNDNFPITGSVSINSYSVTYTGAPVKILTSEIRSYANILLDQLTTFSGQIARARIYALGLNQTNDYQLLSDLTLGASELTVTSSIATGEARVRIGSFRNQNFVNTYWQSGIVNGSSLTISGSVNYNSVQQLDSIHFVGQNSYIQSATPQYFMGTANPIMFEQGNEYYMSASLLCLNPSGILPRMDVYLSGSAFPPSADSILGVNVGSFQLTYNQSRQSFVLSSNFIAPNSGSADVNFVLYCGDWYVSNFGIFSATDFGFNPDEAHTIVPIQDHKLDTLQFKVDLFDANSNTLPVTTATQPVYVSGGTTTIIGTGNRVDGTLNVGSSVSGPGISITGGGYTASGAPVANLPAIYIGQGTYNDPGTPFFVASGSSGATLFSLGNQLTWDGTTLQISGSILITTGSFSSELAALVASSSMLAISESNLFSTMSSLDGRIFTDAFGRIDKAPTGSISGLYLGSTNLGYFNSGSWQTYMNNLGEFFLTGSTGSSNYLSWDGTNLQIAGNINIVSGVTYNTINAAATSASSAQTTASVANSNANNAALSASAVQTIANIAQLSASNALNTASIANSNANNAALSASNVQSIATNAQTTASNAQATAAAANLNAINAALSASGYSSSLAADIFTDSSGKLIKTPSPSATGLFLGSDHLGYYNGSAWKTYMSSSGNFFLAGSSTNALAWDGTNLTLNVGAGGGIHAQASNGAPSLVIGPYPAFSDVAGLYRDTGSTNRAKVYFNTTDSGAFLVPWQVTIGAKATNAYSISGSSYSDTAPAVYMAFGGTNASAQIVAPEGITMIGIGSIGTTTEYPLLSIVMNSVTYGNSTLVGSVVAQSTLNVWGTSTLAGLSAGASTLSSLGVTGNQTVGGTLGVTGTSTLAGLNAGSTTLSSLGVTGNQTVGGTLGVTGVLSTTGAINAGGDVVAFYSSDKRLKNNIELIKTPLEKINKISGVSFVWNEKSDYDGISDIGVIAQEIESVLPEVVTTRTNGFKAVRYEKIIPLLIEAIKELQIEIKSLKEK